MYYADPIGCDTKDPAVVRYAGAYWMYYSKHTPDGWQIGIARSDNLLDWRYQGMLNELKAPGSITTSHMAAPGARVINGRVELFYQDYVPDRLSKIFHVYSRDGRTFEGGSEQATIAPQGAWNCGRAIDADVLVRGDTLLLYWATRDPEMKVQMQGVSAAKLGADYTAASSWRQLNLERSILAPQVQTPLDLERGLSAEALEWEGLCIEAAATMLWGSRILMFYGGAYNNAPQQIGAAISDDGVHFRRLNAGRPILPPGPPDAWNAAESGHPFLFTDDDGQSYLFYQGDNPAKGMKWRLSMLPVQITEAADGDPVIVLGDGGGWPG